MTSVAPIGVDEHAISKALGISLGWLRKDRRTKRIIPFYKFGTAVRYNPERVREALAVVEEGGSRKGTAR